MKGGEGEEEEEEERRREDAPCSSAFFTTQSAARSLTDPPGFWNSALPRILHPVRSESLLSRIWYGCEE